MPISEKIIEEINRLEATEAEKKLMLDILNIEDLGTYHYINLYEWKIGEFIKKGGAPS